MQLDLSNVTLLAGTARDHKTTLLAIDHCCKLAKFFNIVYFSDLEPNTSFPYPFSYINCPTFKVYADVCTWFMTSIFKYNHLFQNHILAIHWDGFIVRPEKWNSIFLNYDYIGSPWPNRLVGNNGFALYSKKLFDGIERLNLPATHTECHGSDKKICLEYRQKLIDFGINFCPYDLAFEFSTETYGYMSHPHGFKYNGSFGFHGLYSISNMKTFDVQLPEHCLEYLNIKGDETNLLSVPEFLEGPFTA